MSRSTYQIIPDSSILRMINVAVDESKAAGTTTLLTSSGGALVIVMSVFFQTTVAATFTSMQIQVSTTTIKPILGSGSEGLVTNLTANKNVQLAAGLNPIYLASGTTIQQVMTGATGTGAGILTLYYYPQAAGAILS